MRRIWLRSLLVIGAGLAVLAVVLYVATTVDGRPPTVTTIRLTQVEGGDPSLALTTTSIEVVFSEPVVHDTAERALSVAPSIEATVSWSGTTLIFTPADPLPLETEFRVEVGPGVRDPAGNVSTDAAPVFAFVTVGRPGVVASEPASGADEVALDATIRLTFSRLMDIASVEEALTLRPSTPVALRWSGTDLEIVPERPLRPATDYRLTVGPSAADLAGITLAAPVVIAFRTMASDLEPTGLIPADGSGGIAVTTPIAIVFDRALDASTLDGAMLTVTPAVAGSLEAIPPEGAAGLTDSEAQIVRFTPSSTLPANTTFTVELAPGLRATDGGRLAVPVSWTFTTGAPLATLGNHVVFLSDRSGVKNLWSMNPDGTNQHQVSAELSAVIDYAIAPDGRWVAVADGARLVLMRPDGSERRVLTEQGLLEYDPAFSPDGRRIAFGRADATSGGGLGIWERDAEGGGARRFELPAELVGPASPTATPSSTASPGGEQPVAEPLLRSPRYSPDGGALAFVDLAGRIAILELPAERLTTVAYRVAASLTWLLDSSGVLVTGAPGRLPAGVGAPASPGSPVPSFDPLDLGLSPPQLASLELAVIGRAGGAPATAPFGRGILRPVVDTAGRVAYLVLDPLDASQGGALQIAASPRADGMELATDLDGVPASVAFAPWPGTLLVTIARAPGGAGGIWLVSEEGGEPVQLSDDGWLPRWLP